MNFFQFIKQNLLYYRKKNFFLALGIAVSAAVITGSLIVGDSVSFSLNRIVEYRLGKITHVIKYGDRYFSAELGPKLGEDLGVKTSTALLVEGIGVAEGGQARIGNIQVLGVDKNFDTMAGTSDYYGTLSGDEVILSSNLASRLGLKLDDEILMRLTKASLIPLNAPFVSDKENVVSVRLRIVAIAGTEDMGRFNLRNSQTAPFNAFISYDRLCEIMDFRDKANLIFLAAEGDMNPGIISAEIRNNWSLSDAGMKIEILDNLDEFSLTSDRVFIDDVATAALLQTEGLKYPVFTYFVNSLKANGRSAPYSFVSTIADSALRDDDILVNEWLASDLGAAPGDSLEMEYFIVGPLRELEVKKKNLRIKAVVPMTGYFADDRLMPDIPGLSDAGNCRDWETGIPVQLEKIRDKDEDYWKKWKGTPKAFITVNTAKQLWENRFGKYTAFRFSAKTHMDSELSAGIMSKLDPGSMGFRIEEVRKQGEFASANGVDFSQLFAGLGFFLLAGGIILTILLFLMNIESRKEQLATVSAMGIPLKTIRRLILTEGMIIAFLGSLLGLLLAVFYNRLIFSALNGIWSDIVRTDIMIIDIRLKTLLIGLGITMVISWLSLLIPLDNFLKSSFTRLKRREIRRKDRRRGSISAAVSAISGIAGIILVAAQLYRGEITSESVFFLAGGFILVSGISGFYFLLQKPAKPSDPLVTLHGLSKKSVFRNPARSMSIVILFSLGSFLVVSTGSNRKNLFRNAELKSSGTGGFLYYAESTVPVLRNLNDPEVQYEYGLNDAYRFLQLRVSEGDDASCLNLNRIMNPAILGVNPAEFRDRFSFVSTTPFLDAKDPWGSLEKDLPGKLVPAIADETVIKWGLGMKAGDTLHYKDSKGEDMKLLLIGGLAPSIFQGNVIISDRHFLESYPESNGTGVFLVEGRVQDTALIVNETGRALRDFGWEISLSAARLAGFNSVTNTYLSIFMVLGALGLLLGTVGLAIVLFRSILERKQEIALLRAIGLGRKSIRRMIVEEYMILLSAGVCIGFFSAVISTLPAILSPETGASLQGIVMIFIVLMLNGWFWTHFIARQALQNKSLYEALRNE